MRGRLILLTLSTKVSLLLLEGIDGSLACLVSETSNLARDLVDGGIDVSLVLQEERPDDAAVDDIRAIVGSGHVAPNQESALGQPVEGHPGEEDVREELNHGEHGKHHPVGEPASIIFSAESFQSLDAGIGRIRKGNDVADEFSTIAEDEVE